ncbi:MAG: isoaspartyl peptidase/L-asparaginase [Nocardioidaceae bacterium]
MAPRHGAPRLLRDRAAAAGAGARTQCLRGGRTARHGTVGAVACDSTGNVAAATSTGGMTNQQVGRVGDTPLVGAGTFAGDESAAISCTGQGEYFVRGLVAYDVAARMTYLGTGLEESIRRTFAAKLDDLGADGGLVAVDASGDVVLGFNSARMFRGYVTSDASPVTMV